MTAVRELTFDRFIVPAFSVKAMGGEYSIEVTTGDTASLKITHKVGDAAETTVADILFTTYTTLESVVNKLIDLGIVIAYTPYFKGSEPSTGLIKVPKKLLTDNFTGFRRYFFSDQEIKNQIAFYYCKVLDLVGIEITDDVIGRLVRPSEQHMAIWVAYQMVDKRRLYENASLAISSSFTDGSDYVGAVADTVPSATSVQIGSVFSISENAAEGFFQEDFNRMGSDNIWGDRYSFWYKLMLYLRQLLEETFGDVSLRKSNIIVSSTELVRDLDFRSYYDSYPFTLSPLSRGILSKT